MATSPQASAGLEVVKLQLKSTLRQFQTQHQFLPLPSQPQPGCELEVAAFLKAFHVIHSQLRYCFQCLHMGSSTIWDADEFARQIAPPSAAAALDHLIAVISSSLMTPSGLSSIELLSLGLLQDVDSIITFLINIYNTFLEYPPSSRPQDVGATTALAKESVLGWSNVSRSSLPLVEAALLLQLRTGGFLNASTAFANQSRILNATTVSYGQGQLEWLALVVDTLASTVANENDLEWYKIVTSHQPGTFPGSQSLVMNEIMLTETTIDRPNELFELLNPTFSVGLAADLTYNVRRRLACQRLETGRSPSMQPAATARAMMRHIHRALKCEAVDQRKRLYERWIRSEWDAPSILFDVSEICQILKHLDREEVMELVLPAAIRILVLNHRGLKAVCSRARSLAHKSFQELDLSEPPSQVFLENSLLQYDAIFKARFFPRDNRQGQVLDGTRVVGTDATKIRQPRRLWDLIFNTTIESDYTSLPWVSVSHSWSQADGDCLCFINGRANIIPWCTLTDLNNVREAMLQTGLTLGWMDKICLRQRGVEGFDAAPRILEWGTDIPFIDVAYRYASKIIVYLDGAGRDILYRSTFREGSSWLFRKWTAQETPQGIPVLLASGSQCVGDDFFDQCQEIIGSWHTKSHKNQGPWQENCTSCKGVWERLSAVRALRNLAEDASDEEKLRHVSDVVKGRVAGCAPDYVFSLLSLLGITERPRYDPKYNLEQAVSVVMEHLSPGYRQTLEKTEHAAWFDGLFTTASVGSAQWINAKLAAFNPRPYAILEKEPEGHYELHGILSHKDKVIQIINAEKITLVGDPESKKCACEQISKPLDMDNQAIYSDFFIWHGIEACCAAISNVMATEADKEVLTHATHLVLSENRLCCVLLEMSKVAEKGPVYKLLRSDDCVAFNSTAEWTVAARGQQTRRVVVESGGL
ncbi:hypothetical protein EG329_005941 [Mollisiaceae sp. DMI_Dod_QoI]|nr:hypothetical protein EG329_005941 [Helotiales sp. DMI_Dod_QoI]